MNEKILQTQEDLQKQLREQLNFLILSAEYYDKGITSEAKRMATSIRILLHDSGRSHSLLGQLKLKESKFLSTALKISEVKENEQLVSSYLGLIAVNMGSGIVRFIPYLDEGPSDVTGYIDFDEYWNEPIFIDKRKISHSRKEIVLCVANQDGGVHVDPGLDEKYSNLSRQNSLGWMAEGIKGNWLPINGAELAAIRQITHEVLRTLMTDYPYKKMNANKGIIVGGLGLVIETKKKNIKIGRNDPCWCGSGKKFKKCHWPNLA